MSTNTTTIEGVKSSTRSELSALLGDLDALSDEAQREFGGLSAAQLNWKPDARQWSVGQCFEHLIRTNESFVPVLEQLSRGEWKPSAWQRLSPLSRFFGGLVLKAVSPDSGRKAKSPSGFKPSESDIEADIVRRFTEHQTRLAGLMRANEGLDLERIIVTSPVAAVATYSLLDAYRIMVAHERRHYAQARRVTQTEGFPRS
jgi:hypothetical protein